MDQDLVWTEIERDRRRQSPPMNELRQHFGSGDVTVYVNGVGLDVMCLEERVVKVRWRRLARLGFESDGKRTVLFAYFASRRKAPQPLLNVDELSAADWELLAQAVAAASLGRVGFDPNPEPAR